MFRPVATVTVSPATNRWAGMKLAPVPSESARTRPGCTPLFEPVTVGDPIALGETPRKVSWVDGAATRPPGIGNTYTVGDAASDTGGAKAACTVTAPNTAATTAPVSTSRDIQRRSIDRTADRIRWIIASAV